MFSKQPTPSEIFSKLGSMPDCPRQHLPVQQPRGIRSSFRHGGLEVESFSAAVLQPSFRWPLTHYRVVTVESVNRWLRGQEL